MSSTAANSPLVLPFEHIGAADLPKVGGKGANLGEMARAGFPVPPGFCVTTAAFDVFVSGCGTLPGLYASLDALTGDDVEAARKAAQATRAMLGEVPMPKDVAAAVLEAFRTLGPDAAWAVRSSATAEDLPDASFAGQQDTYLNVRGEEALLDAVRRCWASLFSDRAVLYRSRSGYGHRDVKLAVVVQRMVNPEVSGILFTADPVSGRRGTLSIEAGFGLGEALVGGLITADLYRMDKHTGEMLEVRLGDKALAIRAKPEGGTWEERLPDALRHARTLEEGTLRALLELGVRLEQHYGKPQDVEWCIEAGRLYVVQTRPITQLYPLPSPPPSDDGLHAYLSFGHFQMMTDPMPPLATQVWRLLFPFGRPATASEDGSTVSSIVTTAGSRLYLDFTPALRHPVLRRVVLTILGHVYPTAAEGLGALARRPALQQGAQLARVRPWNVGRLVLPLLGRVFARLWLADPDRLLPKTNAFIEGHLEHVRGALRTAAPGAPRLREARRVLSQVLTDAFLTVAPSVAAGLLANGLLKRVASGAEDLVAIERGLPGNITTEMDLAVGDLADRLRSHPELAALCREHPAAEALAQAARVDGGPEFLRAWTAFLERFGMRGPGEVDLSRPRYRDDPTPLVAALLGAVGPASQVRPAGAHRAHHASLATTAREVSGRVLEAARRSSMGLLRAALVRRCIRVARAGMGLREHPKFLLVRVLDLVREVVREAGELLVRRGALAARDDVYLFRFEELLAALEAKGTPDLRRLADERRSELARDGKRAPPLIMASDGEIPAPAPRTDLPDGALSGTAASSGVVEGTARVVLDPSREVLQAGEILVAPHTDPGWTPLFVHASGLVTEVGGLITHGSVVAREYGIPAVVSVAGATQRIRTGQRIRVDGTRGVVEILEGEAA